VKQQLQFTTKAGQQTTGISRKSGPECKGRLRGHLRGVSLEMMLLFHRLAAKHSGVAWCRAQWFEREGICSRFWASQIILRLLDEHWLEEIEFHGRRAFRVLTHEQWAKVTRCVSCSLTPDPSETQESCAMGATNLHVPATIVSPGIENKELPHSPFGSEGLKVHGLSKPLRTSEAGVGSKRSSKKKNLVAGLAEKIAAKDETLCTCLNEWENDGGRHPDWWHRVIEACEFAEYALDEHDRTVSISFVGILVDTFEAHRDSIRRGELLPGIFSSKVIDACVRNRECPYFPPSFGENRNRLRKSERTLLEV
jgi:hypothetical protein